VVTRAAIKKLQDETEALSIMMGASGPGLVYVFCPEWLDSAEVKAAHIELYPETEGAKTFVVGGLFGGVSQSSDAFRLVVQRQNETHGIEAANRLRVKYQLAREIGRLPKYSGITGPRCVAYGIGALCEAFGLGEAYARKVLTGAGIDLRDPFNDDGFLEGMEQTRKFNCGSAEKFAAITLPGPSNLHKHEDALAILAAEGHA